MARRKRKDTVKVNDEVKVIETTEIKLEETQDLTMPENEIQDKIDLSDTAVALDEIQDKELIEEKKSEEPVKEVQETQEEKPAKKTRKTKEVKKEKKEKEIKVKKADVKIKETEATTLPPFDIDEDFFTGERRRQVNVEEIHKTYVIDQLV